MASNIGPVASGYTYGKMLDLENRGYTDINSDPSTGQIHATKGQVLGVDKDNSGDGGGGGGVNESTPGAYKNEFGNWVTNSGGGDSGQNNANDELKKNLDEWGNRWNQYYGKLKGTYQGAADTQKTEAQLSADKTINRTKEDAAATEASLGADENKAMGTLDTAINEAVRAYQALAQQGRSRFGMGNSAGEAVGELARKEFFRQQGNISTKKAEVGQEFQAEKAKLATFVRNKVTDVEDYLRSGIQKIETNLAAQMAQVDGMQMESEQQRDQAKLDILQRNVQEAQQKEAQAQQLFQGLFDSYITNLQQVEQRVFSPREIQVALQEFNTTFGNIGLQANVQSTAAPQIARNIYATGNDDDQNA